MKTLLSKTLMAATIVLAPLAASAQHRADQQHLDNSGSFSMILLGDPQGYVKYDINQPLFELQTAWIADNIDNLNIKAVLCTGDLVETNENIIPNRIPFLLSHRQSRAIYHLLRQPRIRIPPL